MQTYRILYRIGLVSLLGLGYFFFVGVHLPEQGAVVQEISQGEPLQEVESGEASRNIQYGELNYEFIPHATYHLYGLVVSLHHSDSFIDISHKYDPANTVDLCVVWGENITSNGYRMVSYDHGDFTCYYRWEGRDEPPFRGTQLSNNHIVPANKILARLIKSVKVGDQVELFGELVDYSVTGKNGTKYGERHTSLVRSDQGNGACEIIYLTEARIIKRNEPFRQPLVFLLFLICISSGLGGFWLSLRTTRTPTIYIENTPRFPNPFAPKNYMQKKTENEEFESDR